MLTTTKYRERLCPSGQGRFFHAVFAQLAEHRSPKPAVAGSSPASGGRPRKGLRAGTEGSGLTQRELAEKLGVITGTIGYYERGAGQPKTDNLFELCDILHIRPADLLRADP